MPEAGACVAFGLLMFGKPLPLWLGTAASLTPQEVMAEGHAAYRRGAQRRRSRRRRGRARDEDATFDIPVGMMVVEVEVEKEETSVVAEPIWLDRLGCCRQFRSVGKREDKSQDQFNIKAEQKRAIKMEISATAIASDTRRGVWKEVGRVSPGRDAMRCGGN